MLDFRLWFETKNIPHGAIKIHLPPGRMQRKGACGAQAFRAVCRFFNVGPQDEKEFMDILGTTKNGTLPERIIKHAKEFGFQVRAKTRMTIEEIIEFLDQGIPVICSMQSYGEPKKYNKDNFGHYVVIIGYDKKHIYFEDSSLKGTRGVLPIDDFISRWHDKDAHGHDCEHMGIAMWIDKSLKSHKIITKAKYVE